MAKVLKISLHIFVLSPENHGWWSQFFCLQINTKVFYYLTVSLFVCRPMHSKSTQNNRFVISLQYLKENVKDIVDFLHADKIKVSCKLISTLWASKFPTKWYYHCWWTWSSILKVLKVTSCDIFTISQKRS